MLADPALVTAVLVAIGTATPLLQAFLLPAAPNIAHAVFFGAYARALRAAPRTKP